MPTSTSSQLKTGTIFIFHLMVLTVPFFFTWVNEELFEFNKMILVYGFSVVAVSLWLLRMAFDKKTFFKRTYLDIPLLIFTLSQVLSTIFSIHPRTSIFGYYTRFHGGLLSTFAYVGLYYAFVNTFEKKHLRPFLMSFFVAALGVTLYSIPEHFGHSPSCALITGNFDVACWKQKVQDRIFGTFGQPNWLAAYTIMLIPVGTSVFLNNWIKNKTKKYSALFFGGVSTLLLLTLLYTQSRSGFVGLLIAGLTLIAGLGLILWNPKLKSAPKNKEKTKKQLVPQISEIAQPLIGLALVFLIILGIEGSPYTPSVKQVVSQINQLKVVESNSQNQNTNPVPNEEAAPVNRLETGGTDSGEIRKIVWQGAVDVWKRYPLLGSGVETFAYSYYQDRPLEHNNVSEWDFLYNKAHNEFLNFLATTGILGLGSYLSLLIVFGIQSLLLVIDQNRSFFTRITSLGLLSGVIALSISNFFGFSTVAVSTLMFLYFAILFILKKDESNQTFSKNQKATTTQTSAKLSKKERKKLKRLKAAQAKNASEETEIDLGQYAFVGLTILAGGYMLLQVFNIWNADYLFTKSKRFIRAGYISSGAPFLQKSIEKRPQEALFQDELATTYAKAALAFEESGQFAESTAAAQMAIDTSNNVIQLNSRHLSFYKSRYRLFVTLSKIDPSMLEEAKKTVETALQLSPTDAKLVYSLALVEDQMGNSEEAIRLLEKALEMKPNFEHAAVKIEEIKMIDES